MTDSIIAQFIGFFINVDDFCLAFEPEYNKRLLEDGTRKRIRKSTLSLSEIMTIIIWFHMSGYRTFKDYYTREVSTHLRWAFPYLWIPHPSLCATTFLREPLHPMAKMS